MRELTCEVCKVFKVVVDVRQRLLHQLPMDVNLDGVPNGLVPAHESVRQRTHNCGRERSLAEARDKVSSHFHWG